VRAVFLDRDGTLIEDTGYLSRPEEVRVLPGVTAALGRLAAAGYALVVVTNQSGIGRGYFSEDDYRAVDRAFRSAIGVPLDAVHLCPHAPEANCSCRKPAPGMLRTAARELGIELERSWAVGDRERDVLAGLAAGCRAVLIGGGPGPAGARVAPDLEGAVEIILTEAP
jgi:D-glycero-D-manno-heptose 1,7-bisphosphate phosphatase